MEKLRGPHEHYTDTPRHWSSHSEKYTGADSLIAALDQGWSLYHQVYRQQIALGSGRWTVVYFFEMYRDNAISTMAVVDTPIIARLLVKYQLQTVETNLASEDETVEAPAVQLSQVRAMA